MSSISLNKTYSILCVPGIYNAPIIISPKQNEKQKWMNEERRTMNWEIQAW